MNIETKKEKLSINQVIARKSQDISIEGNVIIPDVKPDILKPMNTSGTVCIYKKEIMDGRVRLDGSINLYLMYFADDESNLIRTLNTSLDFTQIIDVEEAREGMTLEDEIEIKSIDCKVLNGRKINILVNTGITLTIFSNENMQIICEIENMPDVQVLNKTLEVNSLIGMGMTNVYAKENITIDNADEVAEIMKVNLAIVNKDIKISYNKILAKSDLEVKIMYLTEDNRINLATAQIPIMGFIDISNVNEENTCDLNYTIKNVLIKPNNNDTKGIYIEVQLEINCSVYEKKEINIIQDLYSPSKDLKFSKKEINAMTNKEKTKKSLKVNEQVQIHELVGHRLYDVEVISNVLSENLLNDKIVYDGNIRLKFMYEVENGSNIDISTIELPFNYTVDIKGLNKNSKINTEIIVSSQDFIIGPNGSVDCNINLEFEINTSNSVNINIIENLNIEDFNENKNYSMVIYFVKSGDTLWDIAKKFRSTVEDIAKINEIDNSNKIFIGQQLFVPKYNNKVLV